MVMSLHTGTGSSLSVIVTVKLQLSLFPTASSATYHTVVIPVLNCELLASLIPDPIVAPSNLYVTVGTAVQLSVFDVGLIPATVA